MTTATQNPPAKTAKSKSLYDIGEDFAALDALLMECGGDVSEDQTWAAVEAWMLENLQKAGKKLDGYYAVIADREARANAQKLMAKHLNDQARASENEADRLRERLKAFMLTHGLEELKGELHKAKLSKASDKTKLVIKDESALPQEYMVPKFFADKDAIAKALEEGKAVDGCSLVPVARTLRLT